MDYLRAVSETAYKVFNKLPDMFKLVGSLAEFIPAIFWPLICFALAVRLFSVLYHKDPGGDS